MKHVRYQPADDLLDAHASVEDYWEIADDGHVVRSIHVMADGTRRKYNEQHAADSFGALPEGVITDEMLADESFGEIALVSPSDFEAMWSLPAKNENA